MHNSDTKSDGRLFYLYFSLYSNLVLLTYSNKWIIQHPKRLEIIPLIHSIALRVHLFVYLLCGVYVLLVVVFVVVFFFIFFVVAVCLHSNSDAMTIEKQRETDRKKKWTLHFFWQQWSLGWFMCDMSNTEASMND